MNSLPHSPGAYSPTSTASLPDTVPTEPLNASERQVVHEYMERRQHFLSDYERYNPVQNMHMLANHVFDLSENINTLKRDVATSRRTLDFVSDNQRELNSSMRAIGEDVERLAHGHGELRSEMGWMKDEMGYMKEEMGQMRGDISRIDSTLTETRHELHMLREDVNVLKRDMVEMRREQQSNFNELKGMISLILTGAGGFRG